ncbi:hypothetical protein [Roseivirga sp.]|uniref:hypothetical protein n=1 Tax=Roseivirga sp. TaxID=1964215 RepID=UPI003B5211B5
MRLLIIIPLLVFINPLFSQDYKTGSFQSIIPSPISTIEFPKFKGGKKGLDQYLKDHVKLPDSTKSINKEGVIVLHYRIGTKNKILEVTVDEKYSTMDRRLHSYITKVLLQSGPWQHGTSNGKPMISTNEISFQFN